MLEQMAPTQQAAKRAWGDIDTDGSGDVSFEEFCVYFGYRVPGSALPSASASCASVPIARAASKTVDGSHVGNHLAPPSAASGKSREPTRPRLLTRDFDRLMDEIAPETRESQAAQPSAQRSGKLGKAVLQAAMRPTSRVATNELDDLLAECLGA